MELIKTKLTEMAGFDIPTISKKLVDAAKTWNGKVYLVGGAVRDELLGAESKDLDFLVTKISLDDLQQKLKQVFPTSKINEVGKSFGVIKMSIGQEEFDFTIPRSDIDRDNVTFDQNLPVEQDLLRRDLTINSLAKDLETGEIINPPGEDGVQDIKNKVLKTVGNPQDRFREDPLRILRVIQFASRFGFSIDPQTITAIKDNVDLLRKVSSERFYEEFKKGLTKGSSDSKVFFDLLHDSGIGMLLFGRAFNPIPLRVENRNFNYFIVSMFLKGGEYSKLLQKIEDIDIVETSRWFYNSIHNGIDYSTIKKIHKHGDLFPFIVEAFTLIDLDLKAALVSMLSKPLIPRQDSNKEWKSYELPVTGGQLIEMSERLNKPLKGKAITETLLNLIKAYQDGKIKVHENIDDNIKEIEQYLSGLLTETVVIRSQQIDNLKKRLNNILYDS